MPVAVQPGRPKSQLPEDDLPEPAKTEVGHTGEVPVKTIILNPSAPTPWPITLVVSFEIVEDTKTGHGHEQRVLFATEDEVKAFPPGPGHSGGQVTGTFETNKPRLFVKIYHRREGQPDPSKGWQWSDNDMKGEQHTVEGPGTYEAVVRKEDFEGRLDFDDCVVKVTWTLTADHCATA